MNGKLYYYQKTATIGNPSETLPVALAREVKKFEKAMGYFPEFAIVRLDECSKDDKYPVRVMKVVRNCPPSHFMLCPLIRRTPVYPFEGKKVPCLKKTG